MTKFNYFKLNPSKKIRYLKHSQKDSPYIVFLHGFMSDLDGKKPKEFLSFAKKNKLGFLALEYSGHGKSSGKFINGKQMTWAFWEIEKNASIPSHSHIHEQIMQHQLRSFLLAVSLGCTHPKRHVLFPLFALAIFSQRL